MQRWVGIVMAGWAAWAEAGATLKYAHEDLKATLVTVLKIDGAHVRIESGTDRLMLWDGNTLLVADLKAKVFSRVEPAKLKVQAQGLNAALGALDKSAVKLPPEKRARLEQLVQEAQREPAVDPVQPWTFKATKDKRKIAGLDCTMYVATRGASRHDMCLVPWDKAPVAKADLAGLKSLAELGRGLALRASPGGGPEDLDFAMESFPGFPVLDVASPSPRKYRGTRLVEAATVSHDEATWTLPPGLAEKLVAPAEPARAP